MYDSATLSDDLLTPGADEDLNSPLPGQERQALLASNYNSLGGGVHHQWSVSTVRQWSYLRTLDIPGYHTTTDTNGQ